MRQLSNAPWIRTATKAAITRSLIYFADLRDGYDGYIRSLPEGVAKRISRTARYRRALQREAGRSLLRVEQQ